MRGCRQRQRQGVRREAAARAYLIQFSVEDAVRHKLALLRHVGRHGCTEQGILGH